MKFAVDAVLSDQAGQEENAINEINGTETDCIFSVLPSPYQERFIAANKALLKARVWLGCGTVLEQSYDARDLGRRIRRFFAKKVFKYRVGQQRED